MDQATKDAEAADLHKLHTLNALLDGKKPPEAPPSSLSLRKFRSLVAESKTKRIKAWAKESGVGEAGLRALIGQPGSGLMVMNLGWVKMK